jgi:hypothetical protein
MSGWKSTNPAPVVAALRATHMVATFILLYRHTTLWTLMSPDILRPPLINLVHGLFTRLPLMPGYLTFETHLLLTSLALYTNLFRVGRFHDHFFASRLRAELFILRSDNLMIFH